MINRFKETTEERGFMELPDLPTRTK